MRCKIPKTWTKSFPRASASIRRFVWRSRLAPVWVAVSLCSLVAGPLRSRADDCQTIECDCSYQGLQVNPPDSVGAWADRHPLRVRARLKELEDQGRWVDAAEIIIGLYRDDIDALAPELRARLRDALSDSLLGPVRRAQRDPQIMKNTGGPVTWFHPDVNDDRDQALLFARSPVEVRVTTDLDPSSRRTICWSALSARDLLWRMSRTARLNLAIELQERVNRWNHYTKLGFKPTPLELLANGLIQLRSFSLEPPAWQLVLAHPSLAIETQVPKSDPWQTSSWRGSDVAAVELLGMVVYSRERTQYYGLSLAATYPAGEKPGYGVIAHVTRWASIGPIWRSGRKGTQGFVVSADLYNWFGTVPGRIAAFRDAAAARLRSVVSQVPAGEAVSP